VHLSTEDRFVAKFLHVKRNKIKILMHFYTVERFGLKFIRHHMKEDIQNRDDVFTLVSTFYSKVRENREIGHFFNETIKDWPHHLEKLTDFWESSLFMVAKYRGNPMRAHKQVDQKFDHSIEQKHFGEWLNMWFSTIDELFEGERANIAKNRARNMAGNIFINIYDHRQRGTCGRI